MIERKNNYSPLDASFVENASTEQVVGKSGKSLYTRNATQLGDAKAGRKTTVEEMVQTMSVSDYFCPWCETDFEDEDSYLEHKGGIGTDGCDFSTP